MTAKDVSGMLKNANGEMKVLAEKSNYVIISVAKVRV